MHTIAYDAPNANSTQQTKERLSTLTTPNHAFTPTSTLLLLLPLSSPSTLAPLAIPGGLVVFTTAHAVAFLIFSSHPPTSPTTSPNGLTASSSSLVSEILPELVGLNPPGLRARGIGDMSNDSAGMKLVIEARRVWVGVVSVRFGEVDVGVYCGETRRWEGVRVGCGV